MIFLIIYLLKMYLLLLILEHILNLSFYKLLKIINTNSSIYLKKVILDFSIIKFTLAMDVLKHYNDCN